MKKKISKSVIKLIIIITIPLLILPTVVSLVRDFIEVYKFNIKGIPENYIITTFKSFRTYKNFITIIDPLNGIAWAFLVIVIVNYFIGVFSNLKVKETYDQVDAYGSHGTSRWMTVKEIEKKYYNQKLGWFLGSYEPKKNYQVGMDAAYHALEQDLNMQMLVVGPPGSNKTTGFVLPNIFHIADIYSKSKERADLIITDPKSELYSLSSEYLEKLGYEVRVLDFINLRYGDTMNPIEFISNDKELMEIADSYIYTVIASKGGSPGGEDFYPESSSQLLAALIGYLIQKQPLEKQTFTEVAKLLTSDNVKIPEIASEFFKNAGVKGAANQLWNNFLMAEDKIRPNILTGLATKLKLFAVDGIQNITNSTTVDIRKLGAKKDKPMALFILMAEDRTYSPIISMVINTIFNQLYKTAYKYNNKLATPVYFILEEMANIGKINGIEEKLGTMRGRRIYPMMIWQSLSQMKNRYGDPGWEDIASMCDTQIYLGINDKFTAEQCSDALGDTTIKVQGMNNRAEGFAIDSSSENLNYQKRKLRFPDECRRLNTKKLYVISRGQFPVILYKVQYKYWKKELSICEERKISDAPQINKSDLYENEFTDTKENLRNGINSIMKDTLGIDECIKGISYKSIEDEFDIGCKTCNKGDEETETFDLE